MGSNNPPSNNKALAIPANTQDNNAQGIIVQSALAAGNNNQQNTQNGPVNSLPASSQASLNRRQPRNLQVSN